jgi:hypothetical protein
MEIMYVTFIATHSVQTPERTIALEIVIPSVGRGLRTGKEASETIRY